VIFFANAGKATFVILALAVLRILRISGAPQIANSVVTSVAVNMVQLMRGPFAVNVQPRQTMCGVKYVVKSDCDVAVSYAAARCVARSAPPTRHVPPKNSSVWVVRYERFKAVLRDIFAVHDLNNIRQVGGCQV